MSLTRLIVTTIIIILGIYDLIAVSTGGVDISVSRFFNGLSPYPGPVFVVGYICGHFWGWMSPLQQRPVTKPPVTTPLTKTIGDTGHRKPHSHP